MLSKCMVTPQIFLTNHTTLSITSDFPYPKLCEASHNLGEMQTYVVYILRRCVVAEDEGKRQQWAVAVKLCRVRPVQEVRAAHHIRLHVAELQAGVQDFVAH